MTKETCKTCKHIAKTIVGGEFVLMCSQNVIINRETDFICILYSPKGTFPVALQDQAPKFDNSKIRFDAVPTAPLFELAKVYTIGTGVKYPFRSWEKGMDWGRIISAAERHFTFWKAGERNDPEDNLHHLAHCCWNLFTLMVYEWEGIGTDDRSKFRYLIDSMERELCLAQKDKSDTGKI